MTKSICVSRCLLIKIPAHTNTQSFNQYNVYLYRCDSTKLTCRTRKCYGIRKCERFTIGQRIHTLCTIITVQNKAKNKRTQTKNRYIQCKDTNTATITIIKKKTKKNQLKIDLVYT